jgi:hypothetical protein
LPTAGATDEEILDRFLAWASHRGFELYAHQQEALLELWSGHHVILNAPTGSGKSLVAMGLQFYALAKDRRSFYTSPIKALASEKFFTLCGEFGAERVGMMTGDASINYEAPVICCTAEVLANLALRLGTSLGAPEVVMDEFHFYSDPERGWAWQVPLLELPESRFLLMSATLGDMTRISEHLERRTKRKVSQVISVDRPVPLQFEWRETSLQQSLQELLSQGRAPIYVVSFTQRECAELAQSLTSTSLINREEREKIRQIIGSFRFDTPYGKEIRRLLGSGIGIHHAGLLPKYRLLVEQLAQQGLLKVIAGTDTLGVGVNIPIRTVLFSSLVKFDGEKTQLLSVREFKQIAGRAGRKGFDEQGWVVVQAPESVVQKKKQERRDKSKRKRPGEIVWTRETFDRLVKSQPETLKSRFRVTHGMVLALIQRDELEDDPNERNFASLRRIIAMSHEDEVSKRRQLRAASVLVRSLYRAGILRMKRDRKTDYLWVVVDPELQVDFALYHALSLFIVEAAAELVTSDSEYVGKLLSVVESVLENPEVILRRQAEKERERVWAELKAEGLDYEERLKRIEEVTHPRPLAEWLEAKFDAFAARHPWVGRQEIQPKSIGRELWEGFYSFADYVRKYGLERSEGVLLRYLSQLYRTLEQNVPQGVKTREVEDAVRFLRTTIELTDTSLLEEWESLLRPELLSKSRPERERMVELGWVQELLDSPKALEARVRSEMHLLVHALARRDYEEAVLRIARREGEEGWTAERLERELAGFWQEHGELVDAPEARRREWTIVEPCGDREWRVEQVLWDREGPTGWVLEGRVRLRGLRSVDHPLVELAAIRSY